MLAFGAPAYAGEPRVLSSLRRAFPQSHLLGCSTAGEISGKTVQDQTLALAVARFDRTSLRTAAVPISRGTSFEAGAALGAALASSELRAMLVLSEGLDVNGSRLVEGIRSVVTVPICGGLAADGTRFERTWCIVDGAPRRGFVTAVAFYGDGIVLGFGCEGGWDRFGPEWKLTRTAANVLYEIENRPALSVYKRYLGDLAAGLPSSALYYPLAIRASRDSARSIVRTVLSFSEAEGSLTFAGDMPQGALGQMMKANLDRLIESAAGAARTAALPGAALCVAVSCVGRRMVLHDRVEEEVEAVADVLGGVEIAGFYSYAELSPTPSSSCELHNQTMTLVTFSERG